MLAGFRVIYDVVRAGPFLKNPKKMALLEGRMSATNHLQGLSSGRKND
jgi:hypothetical protein